MDKFELLTVIEVSENNKVLCQFKNCNRPVFKKVHIVRNNEKIQILGSECYKKQYGEHHALNKVKPIYGAASGIALSEDERSLLLENTEELIRQLRKKHQDNEALSEKKAFDYSKLSDSELRKVVLEKTKEDFRVDKGLDPELLGWSGWIKSDAEKLFQKIRNEESNTKA